MGLNVVFSFAFSGLFASLGWLPHGGLALANSAATALEMAALFILIRRRLKGLDGRSLGAGLRQAATGALSMCLALLLWLRLGIAPWVAASGGVVIGGVVYAIVLRTMHVPELDVVYHALAQRLKTRG